jgi:hypothetical protein
MMIDDIAVICLQAQTSPMNAHPAPSWRAQHTAAMVRTPYQTEFVKTDGSRQAEIVGRANTFVMSTVLTYGLPGRHFPKTGSVV